MMNKEDQRLVDNLILKMQYQVIKELDKTLANLRRLYVEEREPILKSQIVTQIRAVASVRAAVARGLNTFHIDGENAGVLTPRKPMPHDGMNAKKTRFGEKRPVNMSGDAQRNVVLKYVKDHPRQTLSQIAGGLKWNRASVAHYLTRLQNEQAVRQDYEIVKAPTENENGTASMVFEIDPDKFCFKCGKELDAEGFCPDYDWDENLFGNGHQEGTKGG